jgi:hypothetical protein
MELSYASALLGRSLASSSASFPADFRTEVLFAQHNQIASQDFHIKNRWAMASLV